MNHTCETCHKTFPVKYRLERHLNKKKPCTSVSCKPIIEPICISEKTTKCQYCNIECGTNIKRHESNCKLRNDNVRILEIKLGIPYEECDKLKCKYCKENFTRIDNINRHNPICKQKNAYLESLQQMYNKQKIIGYIYILSKSDTDNVKVGYTINLSNRLSNYKTSNDCEVKYLFTYKTKHYIKLEKYIHEKLKDIKVKGEWFEKEAISRVPNIVIDLLRNIQDVVDEEIIKYLK